MENIMKYLLLLLILFSSLANSKSPEGKGLICAYGKNKDVYEAYLFFNKQYISKFLFLENNTFKIRQNEKRNYSLKFIKKISKLLTQNLIES